MIRPATPADVHSIASMIRELAEYEHLSHEVVLDEQKLHDHLFGRRPYASVLIAESEAGVVGFALYFYNYSTFLGLPGIYLEDLYVRTAHRGSGHGKALLTHLAAIAVEEGCGRLEWSVLDWNAPSIEFYQKLGARPMDDWTMYRLTGDTLRCVAAAGVAPAGAAVGVAAVGVAVGENSVRSVAVSGNDVGRVTAGAGE